jgi:transcriptional regulator with PAS, ATPase and Fis domain
MTGETIEQSWASGRGRPQEPPLPGLLLVWSRGEPQLSVLPVGTDRVELGRGRVAGVELEDDRMSRRHASVRREGASWILEDLDSRNGSACDGVTFRGELRSDSARVLRCGDSVFVLCSDVRPMLGQRVRIEDGAVIGPKLAAVFREIESAASSGETLHVSGETGSGKELAARRFHAAGPRASGPFVAVNCASIPAALAERLLFGARKGAYSGADQDVDGHLQAAHQGTLFLDELAELDLQVQAKLLRVLETREVLALGASRAKAVSLSVVSATHRSLRERVDAGAFRQDLFFRLARPAVALPPLRERLEDIPWIARELFLPLAKSAHVSLLEALLVRPWPGNLRELALELKEAARVAGLAGAAQVEAEHLPAEAGRGAIATPSSAPESSSPPAAARARGGNVEVPPREVIERALAEHDGNISRAARALGVHRTQLRRWMTRYGLQ